MLYLWIVTVLLSVWIVYSYNQLVVTRARVRNAWAQVGVQLKMRHDLIPNLVATVKGYAAHEKDVFAQVTAAHKRAIGVNEVAEKGEAEAALSGALRSLVALAEAYPTLRASDNFTKLQEQLQDVESRIAFSRQFYNDTTLKYNTRVQTFPSNVIAGAFNFQQEAYFQADAASENPVDVKF